MRQRVRNYISALLSIGLFGATPHEEVDTLRDTKETVVIQICASVPENDFIIRKYESKSKRLVIRGLHCWET